MTYHSDFDRRIDNTPSDWRGPLTEVVDTADAIRLALHDWDINSPELILGLTKLVLDRHDAQQANTTANDKKPQVEPQRLCAICEAPITAANPEPWGPDAGCEDCQGGAKHCR